MYTLAFTAAASDKWRKLDKGVQDQFVKVLDRRLIEPHIRKSLLRGSLAGLYKISLHKAGYRLVYELVEDTVVVLVLSVGKRDKDEAYRQALESD